MAKLSSEMRAKTKQAERLIAQRLPDKIIQLATQLVDESFEKEQYQDGKSGKWASRKNDSEAPKKRTNRRALLVETGKLISSVEIERRGENVSIHSDVEYAQVHNQGEKAGRGSGFQMPKRQFMPMEGEPFPAEGEIDKWMDQQLDNIFS